MFEFADRWRIRDPFTVPKMLGMPLFRAWFAFYELRAGRFADARPQRLVDAPRAPRLEDRPDYISAVNVDAFVALAEQLGGAR